MTNQPDYRPPEDRGDPDLLPGRDYGRGALSPAEWAELVESATGPAAAIAAAHGTERAGWAELDEHEARRYLVAVEEGSPEVDEYEPEHSPMAGEWADDYSPRDLVGDVLGDLPGVELYDEERDELEGELADVYIDAWHAAYRDELVRRARYLAGLEGEDEYRGFARRVDALYDAPMSPESRARRRRAIITGS